MFAADDAILWHIFQFLQPDEYAFVSYHALRHADPKNYVTKSIFAAYITGDIKHPYIRFIHNLPVDFKDIDRCQMALHYRDDAYDEYLRRHIYHEKMLDRMLADKSVAIRQIYHVGIPYNRPDIILQSPFETATKYINGLSNPCAVIRDIVERTDNDDAIGIKLSVWFISKFTANMIIVAPRKTHTLRIWRDNAIIDYTKLEDPNSIISPPPLTDIVNISDLVGLWKTSSMWKKCLHIDEGLMIHEYANIVQRPDADTLSLDWPSDNDQIIKLATIHGHVNILGKILKDRKHVPNVMFNVLHISPPRSGQFVLDMMKRLCPDRRLPKAAHMSCMAFYEEVGCPIDDDTFSLCTTGRGISRDVYRKYLSLGGRREFQPYIDEMICLGIDVKVSRSHAFDVAYNLMVDKTIAPIMIDLTNEQILALREKMKKEHPDKPCLI